MFGGMKANENWRLRYNEGSMQLLGDLYMLSFVRISQLNWIGQVNRMDVKSKVSQVFKNNPWGSRLRKRPKNRWWNFIQTDINKRKIKNGRER
jgi:hypothetical protein